MSKSYTPGLKVLEKTTIQKERLLPLKGKVHVVKDQSVDANHIVASTKIPGNIQMINIANELNIDADQIKECMLCNIDEPVAKGQVIARSKGLFWVFKSEVKSPLDGIIGNISDVTGQIIISEAPIPIEIDAYVPGKINSIIDKEEFQLIQMECLFKVLLGLAVRKKERSKFLMKLILTFLALSIMIY